MEIFSAEGYGHWLELFIAVLERPIPEEVNRYDDPETTVFWKCKKWALKIIERVFDRYGSKGNVETAYESFAEYYTKNYAEHVVSSVLTILRQQAQRIYVSPRVLSLAISHVALSLSHAQVWKMVKDQAMDLFVTVLFPLMRHTEEDDELWNEDPDAYLQERLSCFEELRMPGPAAAELIRAISRRKGLLMKILEFVFAKFNDPATDPREVDAGLNVVAALGDLLCSDRRYKKDVEKLLMLHVKPRINSNVRYVRARALQVLNQTSSAPFSNHAFLNDIAELITERLHDPNEELPVKYEAAVALQSMVENVVEFQSFVRSRIRNIILELLKLLECTHVDELPAVVETIIEQFQEDMIPIAEEVIHGLIRVLQNSSMSEDTDALEDDNGGITTMGILSNLQTVLYLIDDLPETVEKVEPAVRELILHIMEIHAGDFFEECIGMTDNLITSRVWPNMWQVYEKMCEVFDLEGSLFFEDAMGCFHKFVIKDTEAFLADPCRPRKMLLMCGKVLQDEDCEDDIRINAAKMLEVLLLQCPGRLDEYFNDIISLTMHYFSKTEEKFEPFHSQLAVTLIAGLVYNPQQFLESISILQPFQAQNLQWFYERIFKNAENFDGIHDRTMLLYALFIGFRLPADQRPLVLVNQLGNVMPVCMRLFDKIQRARLEIAKNNDSDSESSEEEDINDSKRNIEQDLNDSDDDLEKDRGYLDVLQHSQDSDDDEDKESFIERTDMEDYATPFDGDNPRMVVHNEFLIFLEHLHQTEPGVYQSLVNVAAEKKKDFEELIQLCRREQERMRSNAVEQSGGYAFHADVQIPAQFNFS